MLGNHDFGWLVPGRDGRHVDDLGPAGARSRQDFPRTRPALDAALPSISQSIPVRVDAEIAILQDRGSLGRAHGIAESFQQRRRAGDAEVGQQTAHGKRSAAERATQVELLRAVGEAGR